MITLLYRLILILVIGLIVWELFRQKDLRTQATAALVLIPFILRALMLA